MSEGSNQLMRQVVVVLVAVGILAIAFMLSSMLSKKPEKKAQGKGKTSVKMVQVFEAKNKTIQTQVPIYGQLVAFHKVELYSEVGGMLVKTSRPFKEGVRFSEGDVLLELDAQEQRLNLQAQRSALLTSITQMMPDLKTDFEESLAQWETYRNKFALDQATPELPSPKSDREKDYVTLKGIYNQYYNIKSQEERLTKYVIRAPFSGEITESLINKGSFIRAGQKIGTLMNTNNYELEASIPLTDIKYVNIGDRVALHSEDLANKEWTGRIHRIGNTIDPKTQTVKLFIKVNGNNLRENMFLTGYIKAEKVADVIEIPRRLLIDKKAVYVVQDSSLVLEPVQIVKLSEGSVLIQGIKDGTALLQETFTGAYEGMAVGVVE